MTYFSRFFTLGALLLFPLAFVSAGGEEVMMGSVLKLKTYDREVIGDNYYFSHWGSAVLLDSKHVITNAHVILDAKNTKPTGFYELCRYQASKKEPLCFGTAKLISYDTVADLALLELQSPISGVKNISYSDTKLSI